MFWWFGGMARLSRLVIPGMPHHLTQRGNRRQPIFFNDGDYHAYLELMVEWCNKEGVDFANNVSGFRGFRPRISRPQPILGWACGEFR